MPLGHIDDRELKLLRRSKDALALPVPPKAGNESPM